MLVKKKNKTKDRNFPSNLKFNFSVMLHGSSQLVSRSAVMCSGLQCVEQTSGHRDTAVGQCGNSQTAFGHPIMRLSWTWTRTQIMQLIFNPFKVYTILSVRFKIIYWQFHYCFFLWKYFKTNSFLVTQNMYIVYRKTTYFLTFRVLGQFLSYESTEFKFSKYLSF